MKLTSTLRMFYTELTGQRLEESPAPGWNADVQMLLKLR
jgi:hypothetical protein